MQTLYQYILRQLYTYTFIYTFTLQIPMHLYPHLFRFYTRIHFKDTKTISTKRDDVYADVWTRTHAPTSPVHAQIHNKLTKYTDKATNTRAHTIDCRLSQTITQTRWDRYTPVTRTRSHVYLCIHNILCAVAKRL